MIVMGLASCATPATKNKASKRLPPLKSELAPDEKRILALELAELYLHYGQINQVKRILIHLRRKYPYDPGVLRLTAQYYVRIGKPDMGLKALKLLSKKHPLTQEDEVFMGRLALRSGDFRYAENIFKKWTRTCKDVVCARAWNNLGVVYLAKKNLEKAKIAFIKALEYDPLDEKANDNLAAVMGLESIKQVEEAPNGH